MPGSFRDPSGHVYRVEDQIFRTVTQRFADQFEAVDSTGLIDELADRGLVLPAERVSAAILGPTMEDVKYVLQVPMLPFVSFPYEWSFSALKAAALLHLKINLAALDRRVTLSDASAYNVQFRGAQPVFIDHLSFRPYQNGEIWIGHRQFCEQFLNPLLLRALFGVSHNAWYRGTQEGIPSGDLVRILKLRHHFTWNVLKHVVIQSLFQRAAQNSHFELEKDKLSASVLPLSSFRRMLLKLHRWISTLEPADSGKTVWEDYAKSHSYSLEEACQKRQFVVDFASQVKPKLLWDLGCNTGEYSQAALEAGARYVVGFESDQGALEACFGRAHQQDLPIQALFMDMANPTPNQGWREQERQGMQSRASADGVLALAFVHHLAIARNIPFDQVLDSIIDLAPRGVIEFVPKSDPMVQKLLRLRADIFPDYTREFFLARIARKAEAVRTATVSSSGRLLVWYERR